MNITSIFRWGQIQLTNPTLTAGITAHAGGGQASATQLGATNNVVGTVASGNDSVKMPNIQAKNVEIIIANKGGNSLNVFPQKGGNINGNGTDAAFAIAAGHTTKFISTGSNNWTAIITFATT